MSPFASVLLLACVGLAQEAAEESSDTRILTAAAAGRLEEVKKLVEANPALAKAKISETTALHSAAREGQLAVAEYLLDRGAEIDAYSNRDGTPLLQAVTGARISMVGFLLERGALTNLPNGNRDAPILVAAAAGNVEIVRLLLQKKPFLGPCGDFGQTPLLQAVGQGHLEVVRLLLDAGAGVDEAGRFRITPLESSLAQNRPEIAELLALRGAGPRAMLGWPLLTAEQGKDAGLVRERVAAIIEAIRDLCPACTTGKTERVKAILQFCPELAKFRSFPRNQQPLDCAIATNRLEIFELLLAHGADLTGREFRNPPFATAIKRGNKELVRLLVEKGVALNDERTSSREHPLHLAVLSGNKEMVELLLDLGADPNFVAWPDLDALQMAAGRGDLEITRLLLDRGARVEGGGDDWRFDHPKTSPLVAAAAHGDPAMVSLLLARRANPRRRTENGTPLEAALRGTSREVIELLARVDGQVDPFVLVHLGDLEALQERVKQRPKLLKLQNASEDTLLHVAAEKNRRDIGELLLTSGANPNAKNARGNTPLHIAAGTSQARGLVELLLKHKADLNALNVQNETPLDTLRNESLRELFINSGARSGRELFPGEKREGMVKRPKEFEKPGIAFRGWTFFPGGHYRFTSKELTLYVRNADGFWVTEAVFQDGEQWVKVTVDQRTVPRVTVSEKVGGQQASIQYKDLAEFKEKSSHRAKLYDEVLQKEAAGQLDGKFEIQGPASTKGQIGG